MVLYAFVGIAYLLMSVLAIRFLTLELSGANIQKRNGQGHKPVYPLRFSKSGKAEIEKAYATHFLDPKGLRR